MDYTVAELTVADIWDAKRQNISDEELPFFLLSRTVRRNGEPIALDEFKALSLSKFNELAAMLNLGNANSP